MTYDRRKLIGSLVGGDLDSMKGIPDRYAELVARQKGVIEIARQINAIRTDTTDYSHSMVPATEVAQRKADFLAAAKIEAEPLLAELYIVSDALLAFIMAHFNNSNLEDPAICKMVQNLFDGTLVVDTLDEDSMRLVEDAVVAIAVAKNMLSRERAPWNPQKMKEFHPFAQRYKNLILG